MVKLSKTFSILLVSLLISSVCVMPRLSYGVERGNNNFDKTPGVWSELKIGDENYRNYFNPTIKNTMQYSINIGNTRYNYNLTNTASTEITTQQLDSNPFGNFSPNYTCVYYDKTKAGSINLFTLRQDPNVNDLNALGYKNGVETAYNLNKTQDTCSTFDSTKNVIYANGGGLLNDDDGTDFFAKKKSQQITFVGSYENIINTIKSIYYKYLIFETFKNDYSLYESALPANNIMINANSFSFNFTQKIELSDSFMKLIKDMLDNLYSVYSDYSKYKNAPVLSGDAIKKDINVDASQYDAFIQSGLELPESNYIRNWILNVSDTPHDGLQNLIPDGMLVQMPYDRTLNPKNIEKANIGIDYSLKILIDNDSGVFLDKSDRYKVSFDGYLESDCKSMFMEDFQENIDANATQVSVKKCINNWLMSPTEDIIIKKIPQSINEYFLNSIRYVENQKDQFAEGVVYVPDLKNVDSLKNDCAAFMYTCEKLQYQKYSSISEDWNTMNYYWKDVPDSWLGKNITLDAGRYYFRTNTEKTKPGSKMAEIIVSAKPNITVNNYGKLVGFDKNQKYHISVDGKIIHNCDAVNHFYPTNDFQNHSIYVDLCDEKGNFGTPTTLLYNSSNYPQYGQEPQPEITLDDSIFDSKTLDDSLIGEEENENSFEYDDAYFTHDTAQEKHQQNPNEGGGYGSFGKPLVVGNDIYDVIGYRKCDIDGNPEKTAGITDDSKCSKNDLGMATLLKRTESESSGGFNNLSYHFGSQNFLCAKNYGPVSPWFNFYENSSVDGETCAQWQKDRYSIINNIADGVYLGDIKRDATITTQKGAGPSICFIKENPGEAGSQYGENVYKRAYWLLSANQICQLTYKSKLGLYNSGDSVYYFGSKWNNTANVLMYPDAYWTRTPGDKSDITTFVTAKGGLVQSSLILDKGKPEERVVNSALTGKMALRPALYINISPKIYEDEKDSFDKNVCDDGQIGDYPNCYDPPQEPTSEPDTSLSTGDSNDGTSNTETDDSEANQSSNQSDNKNNSTSNNTNNTNNTNSSGNAGNSGNSGSSGNISKNNPVQKNETKPTPKPPKPVVIKKIAPKVLSLKKLNLKAHKQKKIVKLTWKKISTAKVVYIRVSYKHSKSHKVFKISKKANKVQSYSFKWSKSKIPVSIEVAYQSLDSIHFKGFSPYSRKISIH